MKMRSKTRRGRKSGRKGRKRQGKRGYYIIRGKGFGSRRRAVSRFHRQSKLARRADRRRDAKTVIHLPARNMKEKKELARWYFNPSNSDVKGVDTKFKPKKRKKGKKSRSRSRSNFGRSRAASM